MFSGILRECSYAEGVRVCKAHGTSVHFKAVSGPDLTLKKIRYFRALKEQVVSPDSWSRAEAITGDSVHYDIQKDVGGDIVRFGTPCVHLPFTRRLRPWNFMSISFRIWRSQ